MIQLTDAGKRFGPKLLFERLDWLITSHERVGIVGANGTGKSTLLKALGGLEPLDYGGVTVARGTSIGYLPQDGLKLSGRSVFEEAMSIFDSVRALETELHTLAESMSGIDPQGREYRGVCERYQRVEGEFRARDGYALEAQAGAVLNGLGFGKEDWARRTEEFSGGWQMRIALAKLLLQQPNLLLLDEPTNHLDIETREWLEGFLLNYPHSIVLISHDRYFLDVTVNKIVEIWNRRVHFYSGNYEQYLSQKAMRKLQIEAAYKNQREKIDQLELFINRFRAQATKAKQVQSRIKELERIERIELDTIDEERTIHFTFPQPRPSGRTVIEAKDIAKSYGEKQVFANASFTIERGDRVALVGVNGAGKSTLIRLLSAQEEQSAGALAFGHNVEPDYFAQDQYKALDPERRMLDDLTDAAPALPTTQVRSLLGCFLFSEDDVFKPLGVLSGGERNRYALAKMLVHPSNFLLLDEPTNHLDLRAKDVLLESLSRFAGTIVFVSHDRYFIEKLATRVFEVGGGGITAFPGNYADYLWRKQRDAQAPPPVVNSKAVVVLSEAKDLAFSDGDAKAGAAKAKRINPIKLKQIEQRGAELEEEIAKLESAIAECETEMQDFVSAEELQRQTALLASLREQLDARFAEWEEITGAVEANA
ncbi:MAG: ABC-F family ATP-binding cassette domain-containing protein [Acidobacteriaceae bacterium]